MAVYRRGRIWWILYIRQGKRVRKSAKTSSKAVALAYLQELLEEEGRQARGSQPRRRLNELLDRFETEHLPNLKPRSAQRYRLAFRTVLPHLGEVFVNQLSRQNVTDFISARRKEGITVSTIRRDLASLSSALTLAVGWGWAQENIIRLVDRRLIRPSQPRRRYLTHDEERRLLAAAVPHVRQLIIFAIETGLRREEQLSLRWSQVDLKRRELRLMVTKTATPRIVPLPDRALGVLRSLPQGSASSFVFTNSRTGQRYYEPKRGLAGAAKRAGIKDLRWHDLRRTCGCRLIQDHNADLFHVSRWLGHTSTQMTERAYAFLRVQDLHGIIRPTTKSTTVDEGEPVQSELLEPNKPTDEGNTDQEPSKT
jgi:integrase/recombinase XerD